MNAAFVASKYRKLPSMMGLRHRLILDNNVIDEQFYYISDPAPVILTYNLLPWYIQVNTNLDLSFVRNPVL